MKIIGVSGTNGSGKDTVMKLLSEQHGFLFASATEMFLEELAARGWPVDREHKSKLSAEWRRQKGMGVIVDKAVELFNQLPGQYQGVVVGSLRHPGEADRIHDLNGLMIWVDADPRIRYDRIQSSLSERAGTHQEAGKSFEEFLAEEEREMQPSGDAATLNMSAVRDRADITLINNGNDIPEFNITAEAALKPFLTA